jgi:hypothetical protein
LTRDSERVDVFSELKDNGEAEAAKGAKRAKDVQKKKEKQGEKRYRNWYPTQIEAAGKGAGVGGRGGGESGMEEQSTKKQREPLTGAPSWRSSEGKSLRIAPRDVIGKGAAAAAAAEEEETENTESRTLKANFSNNQTRPRLRGLYR